MAPPQHIGPYQLIRPLGMGGMAETYEGLRRGPAGFEQRVCIKRVLPAYASEPRFVEMFLDEARLLAHLRNANITQVHDFGEGDGTYYMVMELVEGADLEALARSMLAAQRPFPVDVLCYLMAQLLSALSYAHGLSVGGQHLALVHRDISPSNVLVSSHGEVKLTDFGIAKSRQRSHRTKTGHTRGKLAYMSPEQLRGDDVDGRSDLFSLGVVAYEILSGRHPFEADTDLGLIQNIVAGARVPLQQWVPHIPPRLLVLIDDLLRVDREHRPASAEMALSILPYEQAPHLAQRVLADLVKQHQARPQVQRPPVAWHGGDVDTSGETSLLRSTGTTPPAAQLSRTDAVVQPAAGLAAPVRRRGRLIALASGVLGAAALVGLSAIMRENSAPPLLPATPTRSAVVPPRAPTPLALESVDAGAVAAQAAGAAHAGHSDALRDVAGPRDGEPVRAAQARSPESSARRNDAGEAPRTRRARPAHAEVAGTTAATAPSVSDAAVNVQQRGRSGLSVRPDDF